MRFGIDNLEQKPALESGLSNYLALNRARRKRPRCSSLRSPLADDNRERRLESGHFVSGCYVQRIGLMALSSRPAKVGYLLCEGRRGQRIKLPRLASLRCVRISHPCVDHNLAESTFQ